MDQRQASENNQSQVSQKNGRSIDISLSFSEPGYCWQAPEVLLQGPSMMSNRKNLKKMRPGVFSS